MILDSEDQKKMLLQVIEAAPINSSMAQAVQTCNVLIKLREDVNGARIIFPENQKNIPEAGY